jgi:hypothetical protein
MQGIRPVYFVQLQDWHTEPNSRFPCFLEFLIKVNIAVRLLIYQAASCVGRQVRNLCLTVGTPERADTVHACDLLIDKVRASHQHRYLTNRVVESGSSRSMSRIEPLCGRQCQTTNIQTSTLQGLRYHLMAMP